MPAPYPQEFREDVVRVARSREAGVTLAQITNGKASTASVTAAQARADAAHANAAAAQADADDARVLANQIIAWINRNMFVTGGGPFPGDIPR